MKNFIRAALHLILILLCVQQATAQQPVQGSVSGIVTDTSGTQALAGATLTLFNLNDSNATPRYGQAKAKGNFTVTNIGEGRYRLLLSFEGYENQSNIFSITGQATTVNLGNISMRPKSALLQEVIVERTPMAVKNDTTEYNAGSFAVKPNAVAEDVLKKLPGVQVDKSGNITAQGEKVTRILVNGKRFFSDDPKLATRNLPPDIIDKIQVFDDLSDQSKFTGFDDGNRVKTINITTKKDKQQGYFGKAVAGAGTDGNYDESINLHRFKGSQQVSVLGQANDINKQNFTPQDILGNGGGGRRGGGTATQVGSGITTVLAGGLNYRDAWSPNTDAYGSYFFNQQHVSVNQQSNTQKFFPQQDSSTLTNQQQFSIQQNQNHRINFNLEQRFDSTNSLIFRPAITFQHSTPHASSQQTSCTTGGK